MTEALRIKALELAVQSGNGTVQTAQSFYDFLAGNDKSQPAEETKPAKAPKAEKPKAEPKAEPAKAAEAPKGPSLEDLKQVAKTAITSLIEAGLRENVQTLLAEFGAKSATSLAEKGEEAVNAFVAKCQAAELEA